MLARQSLAGSESSSRVLDGASSVHLVGMGGTGVRGLVPLFLARGVKVSGSDQNESPLADKYRSLGVRCSVGHSDSNLQASTDVVLISAAIKDDNPEVVAANQKRIPVIKYAQCLGYLMREKRGIAVAGTHGKTTTTTMVSHVLLETGLDPSFVIGGEYAALGVSSRSGKGPYFVAEACEFDRSFLELGPKAAIVTNIEEEHLDYFGGLVEIQKAFAEFVALLPEEGVLVTNADDADSSFLRGCTAAKLRSFSLTPGRGHWWAEDIRHDAGGSTFQLVGPDGRLARCRLPTPGLHNIRNALACAAVCTWAGVEVEQIASALGTFGGARRRFDVLSSDPVVVIDDYAHHPTEVAALVRAAQSTYPDRKIVGVFQPHQFSRLRRMLGRFADCLAPLDEVIVTKVYRSRDSEEDVRAIDSSALARALTERGASCHDTPEFSEAVDCLDRVAPDGSVVLFMGAGSITKLAQHYAGHRQLLAEERASRTSAPRRAGTTLGECPTESAQTDPGFRRAQLTETTGTVSVSIEEPAGGRLAATKHSASPGVGLR